MLSIGSIVWGVSDVPRAVEFWTAALDYRPREEPGDDWAVLVPRAGAGQQVAIMQVQAPPRSGAGTTSTSTPETRTPRCDASRDSVRRVAWEYEPDADHVVLADPDGNCFCVVQK